MDLPFSKISNSQTKTKNIAKEFAGLIKPGDFVALNGNLGSGKTFFIKSVCEMLGIFNVNSPTFAIVNEYSGRYKVYHFDFYRLKSIEELYDIGYEDYLIDTNAVVFAEWAENLPLALPEHRYEISLSFVDENSRKISIKKI